MTDTNQSPTAPSELPAAYDPSVVERKWQSRWDERGTNHTDLAGENPYYTLMMFPYPSAEGLHVGNLFAFTGNDIHGRYQRMRGHTVFEPLGYDAFGIHSENYALKVGVHPLELIPRNIANFRRQLHRAGLMVDWRYELSTTDAAYYKWTQWLFLQLYQRGLAYKKAAAVNWCPFDKTVLANEQVINGACERCGTMVEQRFLEQWFFRITDYAGRLLGNLDTLDWSESTKAAQRNWIGKSEGAELAFRVQDLMEFAGSATVSGGGLSGEVISTPVEIRVFTTRADTIFGATFLVVAPEHPLVEQLTTDEQRDDVEAYRASAAKQDIVTRKVNKDKTGVFSGSYAINPANGELMQIWVADYVLMEYGTGAIMAVPGHDERDHEFARKFGLPIVRVVGHNARETAPPMDEAFTDNVAGVIVNSGRFNGLTVPEAKPAIVAWLAERRAGRAVVNYRLHDWCISRQRYWGPPIPIIYCDACGPVPVPERDLPVVLPPLEDFQPDDSGVSPLARDEAWYRVPCPSCHKPARRETDVSDTFLDSSWYFLRYPSADRNDVAFDAGITKRWLPVNSYIGGNEHAVLHLLYSRFITMVLHDAGLLGFEEPFTRFRAHGTIVRD
ncbi:MAG TPA: leucine--tRNA ligase, partial [Gemmatimonadaceae bacterium]